jgi:hypothetical protein
VPEEPRVRADQKISLRGKLNVEFRDRNVRLGHHGWRGARQRRHRGGD